MRGCLKQKSVDYSQGKEGYYMSGSCPVLTQLSRALVSILASVTRQDSAVLAVVLRGLLCRMRSARPDSTPLLPLYPGAPLSLPVADSDHLPSTPGGASTQHGGEETAAVQLFRPC